MNKGHQTAHGCHLSRWEQCRSERSRRDIREKYRGRAHRSTSPGRVQLRTPYSPEHRSLHEVNVLSKNLCVQVDSARSRGSAGKLLAGYPERQPYHLHQAAYKHGTWRTHRSPHTAQYAASFIARLNETFINPSEPDVNQLRQRLYRCPTGFGHSLPCERRRSRRWLAKEHVQFPKFCREPLRADAHWHVRAEPGLYPKFREREVYKGLHDVSPRARVRHWRSKRVLNHQSWQTDIRYRLLKSPTVLLDQARTIHYLSLPRDLRA